ncbi:cytochrome P450 [Kitasatospora sp. GAS204A]|nr:cytochrome P450 [Kitasatospora sp. GAS204B]
MHFSDSLDCWVVEGYAEAVAVMRSGALEVPLLPLPRGLGSVAERTALEPLWEQARHIPLYNSGQAHRRLRHELRDAFTRESVEAWRPSIRKVAEESFTGCLPAGRAEVIEDIGKPVLREVMAEVVGIPPDARAEFGRWADVTVRAGAFGTPQWSDGLLAEVVAAVTSIDRLIGEVVADARAVPAGSVLARALERRRHGEGLSEQEISANARALYTAGVYTTTHLIAAAAYYLFRDATVLEQARQDGRELAKVVRETLRFACPAVETALRRATRDVVINGETIRRGQFVRTVVLRASRDPRRFPEPDVFDHERPRQGRELVFGVGSHICLGNHLATAITEEICGVLAAPEFHARLAEPHPVFRRRPAVPVMWGPEWVHLELAPDHHSAVGNRRAIDESAPADTRE